MSSREAGYWSRRKILAGIASVYATGAGAGALDSSPRPLARGGAVAPSVKTPLPDYSSETLIRKANLGGKVGLAVIDVDSGEVLEERLGSTLLPPASTLKSITAIYAINRLGPSFSFATELLATGQVRDGVLTGDLVLKGSGDPTLDTDRLADLVTNLGATGLKEVKGRFLLWTGDLPSGDRIDHDQPEYVGYNPSYGGLNLNFNRVHFEWEKKSGGYDVTMEARGLRFSPATSIAQMSIVDRPTPVYDYRASHERDLWSVAEKALGKNGARWLPVRYPALYTGDVLRKLARDSGIYIPPPERIDVLPDAARLCGTQSDLLVPMLVDMLKYSTNLTAEMTGISASLVEGVPVANLLGSGSRMAGWMMTRYGVEGLRFRDHSGLGYGSAISPGSMAWILRENAGLDVLLKTVDLSLDKKRPSPEGVEVRAKTGTLNFVSSLAGFVKTRSGRKLAFAILTADTERRDAIPPDQRESPSGAKGWSRRSRQLQKELIRGWAERFA